MASSRSDAEKSAAAAQALWAILFSPASPLKKGADMTCGEELIMFNERVLEFEGGAFSPCCKGAQPKNLIKIIERQRFRHVWYR
jgi:hypothetical protein